MIVVWAAFVAAACLTMVSLVGHLVVPSRWRSFHPGVAVLQEISAGMTTVSLSVWLVGTLLGTRYVPLAVGTLVVASLPVARSWVRLARIAFRMAWRVVREHPFAASFLLVPVLWSLPSLLLPVVDSDGLRYHLALPKLFLLEGRVFLFPWDVSGAYPQAAEMLYLLGLQAGSPEAAKWLHSAVVALGVTALVIMVGRRNAGGLIAGLAYVVSPVVLAGAAAAFIDGFALFHIAVAALVLKRRTPYGALGLALAGAAWTKWIIAPAALGCLVLMVCETRPGRRFRTVLVTALLIGLVVTPLMIRNAREVGDPVFPMLTGALSGAVPGVDPELFGTVSQRHRDIPGPLGVPWGTFSGEVEIDEIVGSHFLLALIGLPLLIRDRRVRIAASLVLPYLAIGIVFHPSARLALPMIWGLAVVIGVASQRIRLGWSLAIITVVMVCLLPNSGGDARSVVLPYLRGEVDREGVVRRLVPGADVAHFVNSQQGGGRVMAMDFPAPFLFNRPWVAEGLVNQSPLRQRLDDARSIDDLLEFVEQDDIVWIVVTPGYGGGRPQAFLPLARNDAEARLLLGFRSHLERVYQRDHVDVWRVPRENPQAMSQSTR